MAASGALPAVDLTPFLTGDVRKRAGRTASSASSSTACPPSFWRVRSEQSAAFFALPDEEKAKVRPVAVSKAPLPAGYGRQPAHSTNKNEYLVVFDPKLEFNVHPAEPVGFRETVEECHGKLTELGLLIQEILNECMGLPQGFLSNYNNDRGFDHMTAKRYLPAVEEENIGFSEHEDGNCITFIFQDRVGGLEVLNDGHWVPAEPVDGSIIVNIGDVIQVLSSGKLKSATHRVVREPVHMHSFALFFNLHGDKLVEPLPEFTAKIGEAPRYRRFLYREYHQRWVRNKKHPPARPEDVVRITHDAI